ncbi:MFS transporter [Planomonospora sp. ID67723]|uniref:MFS transporter n=1 Tax=Planomonospora sp. ID67723 TaxID=2738134 RepID=UPI0018C44284|nr:MFS transporter [Planomonospora sp. ID67723]MBG0833216.1 MFS transporter [Planomonospora sp. ID67723]
MTEHIAPARPLGAARSDTRRHRPGVALALILTAQLMFVLDAMFVTIALPDIGRDLGMSANGLSWVPSAYALVFGGLLLLGGRAGDAFGRRRVFAAGVLVFAVASLLAGLAPSAPWLIAARVAQAVGAAFAAPSVLALIMTGFREGPERNRALSVFSALSGSGIAIGLIVGGVLTDLLSWRWVLFINVPLGLVTAVLTPRFVLDSTRLPGRLDVTGALTSTLGVASLVYAVIRTSGSGWTDPLTLAAFTGAVLMLGLFLIVETRASQPIMPLRLFADRGRAAGFLGMLLIPATMGSMFFFLTQFLQTALGFSPIRTGFAFLPFAVGFIAVSTVTPWLSVRLGARPVTLAGTLLVAGGTAWLTRISTASQYFPDLAVPMALIGTGSGAAFLALNIAIMTSVPAADSGATSGTLQVLQNVGASLGLAILVTVFEAGTRAATGPANQVMADGLSRAFGVGLVFAAGAILVALTVKSRPPAT